MALVSHRFGNAAGQAIVLVPGFGDNASQYNGLVGTALVDGYELIAVDLPGCGEAEPESQPLDLERAAQLVANVIVEHGARIITGHSLGSIIASLAAAR
jgi:alpha-beta hydrolase superfamily lysophospholipase